MLRRMVNSQARRLVPGWNLSDLLHARRSVSWTRSSASDTEPEREIAKARRFGISAINSFLKMAEGIRRRLRPAALAFRAPPADRGIFAEAGTEPSRRNALSAPCRSCPAPSDQARRRSPPYLPRR